jgi:hypothetical protein
MHQLVVGPLLADTRIRQFEVRSAILLFRNQPLRRFVQVWRACTCSDSRAETIGFNGAYVNFAPLPLVDLPTCGRQFASY